ncbi:YceI family protein [Abyssalbus ytuae]|uniref:YceI family protein n=1 Tax=Abyssalbus ytuae TaxID=2926907 RepID=A0A9E7D338_9FLAO|nr:YceI family protein [Abyssalbus ytuae]UOB18863.1 YceI family protein [Abyssalbus ytuae]
MNYLSKGLLTIILTISLIHYNYAQGEIEVQVTTNLDKFECKCNEESFIWCYPGSKKPGNIEIPVAAFSCPKKMIEKDLKRLFEADKFPVIKLNIACLNYTSQKVEAKLSIQIKDVKNDYFIDMEISENENMHYFEGLQEINLRDYEIEPPTKLLGLVKVKEEVVINFKIPAHSLLADNHPCNSCR